MYTLRTALLIGLMLTIASATTWAAPQHRQAGRSAESLAKQAAVIARGGQLALAAQMFHAAFKMNASAWEYLYSAARAEQLARDLTASRRDYARYLKQAPRAHRLRGRAMKHATEVEAAYETSARQRLAARRRSAAARKRAAAARSATQVKRNVGWVAVAVGAVGVGAGLWMYGSARGLKSDLEKKVDTANSPPIRLISHQEANNQADRIRSDLRLGGAVIGVSVAVLALGGWLIWSTMETKRASKDLAVGVGFGTTPSLTVAWRF